jgi:hypothetical protein
MATTNSASTRQSRSRNYDLSNTNDNLQSIGRTDLATHRGANETGESPQSSSNVRGHVVSAVDLHEHAARANSAATSDSGQPSLGGGPRQLIAPQTKASNSSQPAAYAHAEPFVSDRADLVRASLSFNPRTCDSNLRPQPRRVADGPHDRAAPALSTSKSSDRPAPDGAHITRSAGSMKPSRSISSNEEPHTVTGPLTSKETSKPSRTMPLNSPLHATASHPTSKRTAKPSRQIVDTPYEPPLGEEAGSRPPQAEKVSPRGTNTTSSKSLAVDPPSLAPADRPPSLPKVPPMSGRSLAPPAPGVINTYSRQIQDTALGEPLAPRGIPATPGAPVYPNESRETALSKTKRGHDPLNGQPAPTNVSSPVRHSTAIEIPSLPIITLPTSDDQSCLLYILHRLQIPPCHLPLPLLNPFPQLLRRLLLHD